MKPHWLRLCGLLILLAIVAFGCGPSAKDKLIGNWQGKIEVDDAKLQQKLNESGNNPIKQLIANKLVEAIKQGSMDFELQADGSFTSSVKLGPLSRDTHGTWEVIKDEGDRVTLQLTDHEGKIDQSTLLFSDDGSFTVKPEGEASEFAAFRCRRVTTTNQ